MRGDDGREMVPAPLTGPRGPRGHGRPPHFDDLVDVGWTPESMYPSAQEAPIEITPDMMGALVITWCEQNRLDGFPTETDLGCCRSLYWCVEDDGGITALDNEGGTCLVEGFETRLEAFDWLLTSGCPGDECRPLGMLSQAELEEAWESLGDVAIDDDDRITAEWRDFPAGTDRFDIFRDFDELYEGGVHTLMFADDRVDRGNPTLSQTLARQTARPQPAPREGAREPGDEGRAI